MRNHLHALTWTSLLINLCVLQKSDSCSVYITYDENWKGQDCQVSYLEVAAAAQAIMDSCQNGDVIGGQHVVRAPGHCACTVSFKDNGS